MSAHDPNPPRRQDRAIHELVHDPYRLRAKPSGPAACPTCGAVYEAGRWAWKKAPPPGAEEMTCPACQRIADRVPAGEITLSGAFLKKHRDEIEALVRSTEEAEKADHPLNRIMDMEWRGGKLEITTTDLHVARRIGHAVYAAYRGTLRYRQPAETYHIRVTWERH